jgi:hypothetical protein
MFALMLLMSLSLMVRGWLGIMFGFDQSAMDKKSKEIIGKLFNKN